MNQPRSLYPTSYYNSEEFLPKIKSYLTQHLITNIHLPQANTQEHSWINISSTYKISEKNNNVYKDSDHLYAIAMQFNHDPTKKNFESST
jgi:hypothetical protein